jgi:hypothetical protein
MASVARRRHGIKRAVCKAACLHAKRGADLAPGFWFRQAEPAAATVSLLAATIVAVTAPKGLVPMPRALLAVWAIGCTTAVAGDFLVLTLFQRVTARLYACQLTQLGLLTVAPSGSFILRAFISDPPSGYFQKGTSEVDSSAPITIESSIQNCVRDGWPDSVTEPIWVPCEP